MQITKLKNSKMVFLGSLISALTLTVAVISPALASAQQSIVTQTNCANLQYPAMEEPTIITDTESGVVSVSYTDVTGAEKQTQLNFKSNDGFVGCSSQAKRILTDVKAHQAKYNADMCDEVTAVVEGRRAMPEMDGKRPSEAAAKIFQKQICAQAALQ